MTAPRRRRGRPPKEFVLTQNGKETTTTYAGMGFTRKKAWVARQYASIPEDVFEALLMSEEIPTQHRLLRVAAAYTDAAVDDRRVKIRTDDPGRAAYTIASNCSYGFVEELIGFLYEYLDAARREAQ